MKRCTAGNHDAPDRELVTIPNGTICRGCATLVLEIVDERSADWTEPKPGHIGAVQCNTFTASVKMPDEAP